MQLHNILKWCETKVFLYTIIGFKKSLFKKEIHSIISITYHIKRRTLSNLYFIIFILGNTSARQQKKKTIKNKQNQQQELVNTDIEPVKPQPEATESKSKKKTKFVNLYSQEGKNAQVVLIKGIFIFIPFIYHYRLLLI